MKKIFISYRHADTYGMAHYFYDFLTQRIQNPDNVKNNLNFSEEDIFIDHNSIPDAKRWKETIQDRLVESNIVIHFVGYNWSEKFYNYFLTDGKYKKDLKKDDILLEELLYALQKKNLLLILLPGASAPHQNETPYELQELNGYQYHQLEMPDNTPFIQQFEKIIPKINKILNDITNDEWTFSHNFKNPRILPNAHENTITNTFFLKNSGYLFTSSLDSKLKVWEKNQKRDNIFQKDVVNFNDPIFDISTNYFTYNDLYIGSRDKYIYKINLDNNFSKTKILGEHVGRVKKVFINSKNSVVSIDHEGYMYFWNSNQNYQAKIKLGNRFDQLIIKISPVDILFVWDELNQFRAWNLINHLEVSINLIDRKNLLSSGFQCSSFAFIDNGKIIVMFNKINKKLILGKVEYISKNGFIKNDIIINVLAETEIKLSGRVTKIKAFNFQAEDRIAITTTNRELKIYSINSQNYTVVPISGIDVENYLDDDITAMAFSYGGQIVSIGLANGKLIIYNL